MSPPRQRGAIATGGVDLLQHLAERMDAIEAGIAALREMLAARLTAVEVAAARVPAIEDRVAELEKVRARGEGAAWAGRVFWLGLSGLAGAAGAALTLLLHR